MRILFAMLTAAAAGCSSTHGWTSARAADPRLPALFDSAAAAFEERRYGVAIGICDDALAIAPGFEAAAGLREYAEKSRHTDDPYGVMAARVRAWRAMTRVEDGTVPYRRANESR